MSKKLENVKKRDLSKKIDLNQKHVNTIKYEIRWKKNVPSGNEAENTLSETLLEEKNKIQNL